MTGTELPLAVEGGSIFHLWPIFVALLGVAGAWGAWRLKLNYLCREIERLQTVMKEKRNLSDCEKDHRRLAGDLDRGQENFSELRAGQMATQELLARVDERVKVFDTVSNSFSEMARGLNNLAQALAEDVRLRKM